MGFAGGLPHPLLYADMIKSIGHWGEHVEHALGVQSINHVLYMWLAMGILFTLGLIVRGRLQLVPGGLQNLFETIIGGLEDFTVANLGQEGRQFMPLLCTIFLFVLTMNYIGLVPGCDAPTANINTPAAMAIIVFLFYNFVGIKKWGGGYIKHFMGPVLFLSPLMLILEPISHIARPLSLTLRLFGNIRGEEIVLILMFLLAPVLGSLPMYFLFILAKTIQAFIFFMLTMLYLQGSIEHAH
ncbi:F0F1 ATP synthase subunit A [Pseudodesulfovibrio piezophilus]|uniref:ATP synthase subunit a n=1 Tax=Pseudodesulfovibrio piezophilus (strain DSM 21447 / JCM 15486 / C1TLV30) TaxID=1322246 RepID=M1WML9_PSEP2|nr:F0F1 ATP synthase subunit A [Pseudodesulfovibrio piezophilus]CCH49790.1 ATP synthase subunit a [Pseudodesulfovibrio piezophilus C1TLV30]